MTFESCLEGIARFSVRRPWTILISASLLAIASLVAAQNIRLKTSNLDLVDANLPEVRRFLDVTEQFGTPNVLVVVLEGNDPAQLRTAAKRIAETIERSPMVRSVMYCLPFSAEALELIGVNPYLTSTDGGLQFIFVQPRDERSDIVALDPFVAEIRGILRDPAVAIPGVKTGITGIPVYALDDRDVIQGDIAKLSAISFLLVLIIFLLGFGKFRRPVLATVAFIFAMAITIGLISIYPGHLTLLSASFASILTGLGIDYGIHIVDRVEEALAAGVAETDAISQSVGAISRGLTAAALTTAAGFFSLVASGFHGFEELGIIAGAGILVCLGAMVTILPALLAIFARDEHRQPDRSNRIGNLLASVARLRFPGPVLLILTIPAMIKMSPGFDADYLNLQPIGSEAVRLERQMVARSEYSPQFAIFVADTKERARELTCKLIENETVGAIRSINDLESLTMLFGSIEAIPAAIREQFVNRAGQYAVYAYPAGDVWNEGVRERFIASMRALDPNVTGMPFIGDFMIEQSWRALRTTTVLASAILMVIVGWTFRRPAVAVLAMVPTILSLIWMLALMRLLRIPLNPLNVMALPILIGIAIDAGVHIVSRFLAENGDVAATIAGTGRSVFLTSLTTIAAFGTLALTTHRGLRSFSLAITIGVTAALVFSITVLPWLLRVMSSRVVPPPSR